MNDKELMILLGRLAGKTPEQAAKAYEASAVIHDVFKACVISFCAALEIYEKIPEAYTLCGLKLHSEFLAKHRNGLDNQNKFLSDLAFWVRDTIQDNLYEPNKENTNES